MWGHVQYLHNRILSLGQSLRRTHRNAPIELMPADILLEIANNLAGVGDKLAFSMTSTSILSAVISSVYANVELEGIKQCTSTLNMLANIPNLARHVQRLVVYPDRLPHTKQPQLDHSQEYSGIVSRFVSKAVVHMDALRSFVWHAEESLPDDYMWIQLHRCCPNLKDIGTSFGTMLPRPSSHLFDFSNLEGFSLIFKGGFYLSGFDLPDRESEPVHNRLWDMLINRSPNLRSLTIEGEWDSPVYTYRMVIANWPRLQSLRLGPLQFADPLGTDQPLLDFLERHPSIEHLTMAHMHANLSLLSEKALPNLKSFNGSLDQYRRLCSRGTQPPLMPGVSAQANLSRLPSTLNSLIFSDPIQVRDLTPLNISGMLSGMHGLTSLTITFSLQSGYDSNGVFRVIVSACPQLQQLELTCTCKPSFYLESFSRTLRGLSKLRTLSLLTVKVPGDESLQASAARIALSNPRLTHFTIGYIPPNAPARRSHPRLQPIQLGKFELISDMHGIPISLLVWESWYRFGGIGARVTRKSIYELRPSGHPDVKRKNWKQLLLERGPAGEEARLLMFSGWLMMLAVWGVAKAMLMWMSEASWRTRGLEYGGR